MASRSKPLRDGFMRGLLILLQPLTLGGIHETVDRADLVGSDRQCCFDCSLNNRAGEDRFRHRCFGRTSLADAPCLTSGACRRRDLDRTQRKWVMAVADAARASGILLSAYAITSGTFSLSACLRVDGPERHRTRFLRPGRTRSSPQWLNASPYNRLTQCTRWARIRR